MGLASRSLREERLEFTSPATKTGGGRYVGSQCSRMGGGGHSTPFRFRLTSDHPLINFETVARNSATFSIYGPEDIMKTSYHGVHVEIGQLHCGIADVIDRAVLARHPWWLLYRNSEVLPDEPPIAVTLESVFMAGCMNRC